MLNLYKASMLCADFPNFRWKLFQVSDEAVNVVKVHEQVSRGGDNLFPLKSPTMYSGDCDTITFTTVLVGTVHR